MNGYVAKRRGRFYAVAYEGLDPVTGNETPVEASIDLDTTFDVLAGWRAYQHATFAAVVLSARTRRRATVQLRDRGSWPSVS